jgi:hypothetical protein
MKRKPANDALTLFLNFQKKITASRPTTAKMFEELQMMRFKIRPLQGDISSLKLNDEELIEILWNLGKLDDFFQKEYRLLSTTEKRTFFQLFDNLHQRYQERLNSLNLKSSTEQDASSVIEMEIFKEEPPKRKLN